jgi:hypothetical protein
MGSFCPVHSGLVREKSFGQEIHPVEIKLISLFLHISSEEVATSFAH